MLNSPTDGNHSGSHGSGGRSNKADIEQVLTGLLNRSNFALKRGPLLDSDCADKMLQLQTEIRLTMWAGIGPGSTPLSDTIPQFRERLDALEGEAGIIWDKDEDLHQLTMP